MTSHYVKTEVPEVGDDSVVLFLEFKQMPVGNIGLALLAVRLLGKCATSMAEATAPRATCDLPFRNGAWPAPTTARSRSGRAERCSQLGRRRSQSLRVCREHKVREAEQFLGSQQARMSRTRSSVWPRRTKWATHARANQE